MTQDQGASDLPDLAQAIALNDLPDGGKLLGRVGEEQVLLVRHGTDIFAVGAHCTHYHGPLGEGLVVGDTVRCPWHHACFDLRTGEAVRAPALSPLQCWQVEQDGGRLVVRKPRPAAETTPRPALPGSLPGQIVVVGGGAAGFAAVEMLRRLGYQGSIVMLSDDGAPPVDRPNLSKDYLAGNAPEDWVPLRPDSFYADNNIELHLGANVTGIDIPSRHVVLGDGSRVPWDRLLLATGAEPVRLNVPGAQLSHVHTLRSLKDCRTIIAHAGASKRAVVLGASFIGLEVAASLRTRGLDVHVVAPESRPMERILGPQLGDFIRTLHEEHGVVFHLGALANAIDSTHVTLNDGSRLPADVVVAGIGVRPRTTLAESTGLAVDRGVLVNAALETSAPGIFAAGDIARWPDRHSGETIRVEHWVVAQRQGQTAARNMLGLQEPFDAVPFFWSQHYDIPINYVGHAEHWDELTVEGDIAAKDCLLRYKRGGRTCAVASIFRDIESLQAELAMERS